MRRRGWLFALSAPWLAAACQNGEAPAPPAAPAGGSAAAAPASPAPASNPTKDAYFGDLHPHTSYSFDAFTLQTNIKLSTKNGKSVETIYDVVWSGDRKRDPKTGKVPPVGNTVDMQTATYANSIGAAQLSGVWEDPDFDRSALATYYVRALEIPTPRWSFIWAIRNHLPPNEKMALVIQERAWSSPIWYAPAR